MMNSSDP